MDPGPLPGNGVQPYAGEERREGTRTPTLRYPPGMNGSDGEERAAAPPPSRAAPLLGAALGAAVGVLAWAGAAAAGLSWSGFLATGVGALAGLGSRRLGGRGTGASAGAAAVALAAIFLGQGFGARATHARNIEGEIAAVNRERYDAFAAAAADWDPGIRGDEIGKFAFRHELLPPGGLGSVGARVAAFHRETVPLLEAWKRNPPAFEAWQAERRAAIRGGASPWRAYLAAPLDFISPLDLLCWLLGLAAAARLAHVPPPPRTFRRRGTKAAA